MSDLLDMLRWVLGAIATPCLGFCQIYERSFLFFPRTCQQISSTGCVRQLVATKVGVRQSAALQALQLHAVRALGQKRKNPEISGGVVACDCCSKLQQHDGGVHGRSQLVLYRVQLGQ